MVSADGDPVEQARDPSGAEHGIAEVTERREVGGWIGESRAIAASGARRPDMPVFEEINAIGGANFVAVSCAELLLQRVRGQRRI